MANPFATPAMAAGYAADRPPIHDLIVARIRDDLGGRGPALLALDVGCGAGLSTRPLARMARRRIGVDPAAGMLQVARTVDREAAFVAGTAERLPVASASADLVTAAGSLNYTSVADALREIHRVLTPAGMLVAYDFASARSLADAVALDQWYGAFVSRYPKPPFEAVPLDPERLAAAGPSLRLVAQAPLRLPVRMTAQTYERYMLTETNVAAAVRAGAPLDDIRAWCRATLPDVFGGHQRDVLFTGYIAYLSHR